VIYHVKKIIEMLNLVVGQGFSQDWHLEILQD
jgi:hypothetical protein